jgi:hypothetical protein
MASIAALPFTDHFSLKIRTGGPVALRQSVEAGSVFAGGDELEFWWPTFHRHGPKVSDHCRI